MKRSLLVLTALLLALAMLAGCAGQPVSEPEPVLEPADVAPDPALAVCVGGEPRTLDPAGYATAQEATYLAQLFEGLTTVAADGRVTAAAAKLWTTDATEYGQPVYTFTLRADALWSDGQPVKAQDFVFAWQRAADPATEAPYGYLMAVLENGAAILAGEAEPSALGVRAVDEATLEVTLEGPCQYFPQLLTLPVFFPLRADVVEANPNGWSVNPRTCISNGYFTLAAWSHDDFIRMTKNAAHYTNSETAAVTDVASTLETLTFRFYENDTEARETFAAGDLHYLVSGVYGAEAQPPEDLAESGASSASAQPEEPPAVPQPAAVGADLLAESYYFVANRTSGPTLNYKFGRALALALDRDALIDALQLMDDYQPATGLIPGGMTTVFTKKPFRELAGDALSALRGEEDALTAAKRYLAEAGFPDGASAPALTLLTNDTPAQVAIANAAAEIWKNTLGVTVNVKALPYAEFIEERDAGNFDLARGGAASDGYDPACLLELFCSDYSGAWYSNSDYDALMKSAALEETASVRSLSLIEAERALLEQGVVIPVLFRHRFTQSCEALSGVVATGLELRYFMYAAH